jgi:hypothetical protein
VQATSERWLYSSGDLTPKGYSHQISSLYEVANRTTKTHFSGSAIYRSWSRVCPFLLNVRVARLRG